MQNVLVQFAIAVAFGLNEVERANHLIGSGETRRMNDPRHSGEHIPSDEDQ
jgi:hypothetical protein